MLSDAARTKEDWQPIVDYLSEKTGAIFELVTPATMEQHLKSMKSGEADFGVQPPPPTAKLLDSCTAIVKLVTTNKFGVANDKQRGLFISRRERVDAPATVDTIHLIGSGHVFACLPGTSTGNALISMILTLREQEIDLTTIHFVEYASLQEVVAAVVSGEADVGAIPEDAWEKATEDLGDAELLADIGKGTWVNGPSIVANNDLPESLVSAVQQALLELVRGNEVFAANSSVNAFVPTVAGDYDALIGYKPPPNVVMAADFDPDAAPAE